MTDCYRVPSLVLTLLMLPAFGFLYSRYRNTRTLLWLLGFLTTAMRMAITQVAENYGFNPRQQLWATSLSLVCAVLGSGLFLASLVPEKIYVGRLRLLYVFVAPLILNALLIGLAGGGRLSPWSFSFLFLFCGGCSAFAALYWGRMVGVMPSWLGVSLSTASTVFAFAIYLAQGPVACLYAIDAAVHFVNAFLVLYSFRRISGGVFLTASGLFVWSLSLPSYLPSLTLDPSTVLGLMRAVVLSKVVAAMGMILITLEDELLARQAAQRRERRMRLEVEAYTRLVHAHHKVAEFDARASEFCRAVVEHGRFEQVAMLLQNRYGRFHLAGSAGLDAATVVELVRMVERIPAEGFWAQDSTQPIAERNAAYRLSLDSWLAPDDVGLRQSLAGLLAVPLASGSSVDGVLLLAGARDLRVGAQKEYEPLLRAEDLLPVEMFAARLASARRNTLMMEKIVGAEKFASLGQLAANVSAQLNNPLTVILGYAALMEGGQRLGVDEERYVEEILAQARRMKSVLESLNRISANGDDRRAAVSLAELLDDLAKLHRPEFLRNAIDFQLHIDPDLPRVQCHAYQLRQAIQHCLRYGLNSLSAPAAEASKILRLEANVVGKRIQVKMSHTGRGFDDPRQAFEPFANDTTLAQSNNRLDLSICSSLLRENDGCVSASNLSPNGAAIVIELPKA